MLSEIQINEFVGKKLRELRKNSTFSLSFVASELELSPQQVQKYEWCINRVSAGKLQRFAQLFDVPISDFFPNDTKKPVQSKPPAALRIIRLINTIPPSHHERVFALLKVVARLVEGK